jgi:hypothetical protein
VFNGCSAWRRLVTGTDWMSVAHGPPRQLSNVRFLPFPKLTQNQRLKNSVLNPRSREVRRQTAREREFRSAGGVPQCGGFRTGPRLLGFRGRRQPAENVGLRPTGGESGIRTHDTEKPKRPARCTPTENWPTVDQRYGATKQEQTSSNVTEHHAKRQIFPAFPGEPHRS